VAAKRLISLDTYLIIDYNIVITHYFQIYLLAAPPSKTVTALFRIHLNLLNGPLLAFLFPETASRTVIIFLIYFLNTIRF
jgi:hypothetical protein